MSDLLLKSLQKVYPNKVQAVFDFDLEIKDGEFIVLVGGSGCGKSTTLRMIAGLEEITDGKLFIDGIDMTKAPPKDRDIAMVFQNYALYGNMTVYQNMSFSMLLRNGDMDETHEKVMAAGTLLGLKAQLNKKPSQLSGGQRQRVAVGRAIVRHPKVFLFDEPLSNLDAKLRGQMRHELKRLHQKLRATMIYVTHDQIEALTLADRIVVMHEGRIQQVGTPLEIYNSPANLYVAGFIGLPAMNFFEVSYKDGKIVHPAFSFSPDKKRMKDLEAYEGKELILGARPEFAFVGGNIDFSVSIVENLGKNTAVHGFIDGKKATFKLDGWLEFEKGETVKIDFVKDKLYYFDKDTTLAIAANQNQEGGKVETD